MRQSFIMMVGLLMAGPVVGQKNILPKASELKRNERQAENTINSIKTSEPMKNSEAVGTGNAYFIRTVAAVGNMDTHGFRDGEAKQAQFNSPVAIIVNAAGELFIADQRNYRIRKLSNAGIVSTVAGKQQSQEDGIDGGLYSPVDISFDKNGDILVVDKNWNAIRKITTTGIVTIAGGNEEGYKDGDVKDAQFHFPTGIAADSKNNIFICDEGNHLIRKISGTTVSTFAGGEAGYKDGDAADAQFMYPSRIAIDANDNMYVTEHNRIRKITPAGIVTTLAGKPDAQGHQDGKGTQALFSKITSIAIAKDGSLYVGDVGANAGNSIRHISIDGIVTTIAGGAVRTFNPKSEEEIARGSKDGPVSHARVGNVTALCVGVDNAVYYCEGYFHAVRKVYKQ